MSAVKNSYPLNTEDYLSNELVSDVKHEFIEGYLVAMAGASANHERLSGNLYRKFGNHLEDKPCEPFGSDMKIGIANLV